MLILISFHVPLAKTEDIRNQLDIQQRKHEEVVAHMKKEIFHLEEFSESQQDLALKMEEEKALAVQRSKELQYEVESERKSHEVEVNILSRKLDNAENDAAKLDQDLKHMTKEQSRIRQDYEAEILKAEKKAEAEICALQNELLYANATISEQSSLQSELAGMKEKLEAQKKEFVRKSSDALSKLEGKHMEQTKIVKLKHKAAVENLQKELSASKHRTKNLQEKLEKSSSELEANAIQIQNLHVEKAAAKREISALDTSQGQYVSEVSELQANVTKLQAEISHMKSAAIAYKSKISSLKAELQKESEFEDLGSLLSSSRRSSTASESSRHEEIFTKMRTHLGELQRVLESKTSSDKDNSKHKALELELINKLGSNSSALDAEVQRMRRGFSAEQLSHKQTISQKDELLQKLQAEKDIQRKIISDLVTGTSEGIADQMDSLQDSCNVSLLGFGHKLDKALLDLASIAKSLNDKDIRHSSAIDTLFSDLDHTSKEISRCQAEISVLQQELQISHHNLDELNESQEQLQREKDKEMYELRSKLEQALKRENENSVSSDVVSLRRVMVDAGSGQVISDHDDNSTRQQELLQKEEIIGALSGEIEQLKQAQRLSNITTEEVNKKLLEKEREMRQARLETESLCRKVQELDLNLDKKAREVGCILHRLKNRLKSLLHSF